MIYKYTYGMYLLRYILFILSDQGVIHKGPLEAFLVGPLIIQTTAGSFNTCLEWCTAMPTCVGMSFKNSTSACALYSGI